MKILVVRFRQMGDTVVALAMLEALKRALPGAEIHLVLNSGIAPLFEGHPAIDRIITFSASERSSLPRYLGRIRRIMKDGRYDALIDMRSTPNTLPFALFPPRPKQRIALIKPYTAPLYTHRIPPCGDKENMADHNYRFLLPLLPHGYTDSLHKVFRLYPAGREIASFRIYMAEKGIDFSRPVMLAGVTAKLPGKAWRKDRMAEVIRRFLERYPQCQVIFNYAPGREEQDAAEIWSMLDRDERIFFSVRAGSLRELSCMAALSTFYFGLEGGSRHIAQAVGKPSYSIVAPGIRKKVWIPETDSPLTRAIAVTDLRSAEQLAVMSREKQYDLLTADVVWEGLLSFLQKLEIQ